MKIQRAKKEVVRVPCKEDRENNNNDNWTNKNDGFLFLFYTAMRETRAEGLYSNQKPLEEKEKTGENP